MAAIDLRIVGSVLFWLTCYAPLAFAELSMETLIIGTRVPWTEKFKTSFQSTLDDYNKQRRHKAIAVALTSDRHVAMGRAWNAASPLAATQHALSACEQDRANRSLNAQCEIVISNNQVIPLGTGFFSELSPGAPAPVWRIKNNDSTVYLLGTVHVLKATVFPLPAVFDQVFDASDQIAQESNVLLLNDPEVQRRFLAAAAADSKLIERNMPKSLKKNLKAHLNHQRASIELFYPQKPVFTAMQLDQLNFMTLGLSYTNGLETYYARLADSQGKAILELEDPVETIELLSDQPLDQQFEFLAQSIRSYEASAAIYMNFIDLWKSGDADAIYNEMVAESASLPDVIRALLDTRNIQMVKKMQPLFEGKKTTLVMVGAGHFGGEKGILQLLKNQGYTIAQLSNNGAPVTP